MNKKIYLNYPVSHMEMRPGESWLPGSAYEAHHLIQAVCSFLLSLMLKGKICLLQLKILELVGL